MERCGCLRSGKAWDWLQLDEADANLRRLTLTCTMITDAYVAAAQAFARARKAESLLGEGAGLRDMAQAEAHHASVLRLAGQARRLLGVVARGLESTRRGEFNDILSGGALQRQSAAARARALTSLIESDCSNVAATQAVARLDESLTSLAQVQNADDAIGYLEERITQLSDTDIADLQSLGENPLCMLVLMLSSLYVFMAFYFLFYCGQVGCDPVSTFDQWWQQACSTST
jgi:hypothetical protein